LILKGDKYSLKKAANSQKPLGVGIELLIRGLAHKVIHSIWG
jgi:hypothetical protein